MAADVTRRSQVAWVDGRCVWQVWHDGSAYVVSGGLEQELSPAPRVEVVVRSRIAGVAARWDADVTIVEPGTPLWDEVVPLLHARRLNAPDGEAQPARWAADSTVWRLTPA